MSSKLYARRLRREILNMPPILDCCRRAFLTIFLNQSPGNPARLPARLQKTWVQKCIAPFLPRQAHVQEHSCGISIEGLVLPFLRRRFLEDLAPKTPMKPAIHCQRYLLAALFVRYGYMQDPSKGYHLEIACRKRWQALLCLRLGRLLKIPWKMFRRRERFVFYLKHRRRILRFLHRLELHGHGMTLQDLVSTRELFSLVNRQVNFETANINKQVSAADRLIEQIHRLLQHQDQEIWSRALRELAQFRVKFPLDSYEILGARCAPPLTKSAVNHRLRRISKLFRKMFPPAPAQ